MERGDLFGEQRAFFIRDSLLLLRKVFTLFLAGKSNTLHLLSFVLDGTAGELQGHVSGGHGCVCISADLCR